MSPFRRQVSDAAVLDALTVWTVVLVGIFLGLVAGRSW